MHCPTIGQTKTNSPSFVVYMIGFSYLQVSELSKTASPMHCLLLCTPKEFLAHIKAHSKL